MITIHDIYNYGSVLQTLATQELLSRAGLDVEIIDYKYPTTFHRQGSVRASVLRAGNSALKSLLPGRPQQKYESRYRDFKREHLKLSPREYRSPAELVQDPPVYDLYVVGSDQVWRSELTQNDPSFFLGFASGVKVAFASSFGVLDVKTQYRSDVARWLGAFSLIGVREESGRSIVRELTGKDATVCLDSTLMLTASDWRTYSSPTPIDEPYVLCYGGGKFGAQSGDFVERAALDVARERGCRVVRLNGKFFDYFNRRVQYVLDAGPAEFLGYFANASFVIARSYHGTIFSLLFHKDFLSVVSEDRNHSSRQQHLLERLGLESRLVVEGDSVEVPILDPIDYDAVDDVIHELRAGTSAFTSEIASL